jgi:hypothetical protein
VRRTEVHHEHHLDGEAARPDRRDRNLRRRRIRRRSGPGERTRGRQQRRRWWWWISRIGRRIRRPIGTVRAFRFPLGAVRATLRAFGAASVGSVGSARLGSELAAPDALALEPGHVTADDLADAAATFAEPAVVSVDAAAHFATRDAFATDAVAGAHLAFA